MPYYKAGDYYRGDGNYAAGGIFGTLGKIAKTALGGAVGFIKGGPVGALQGAAKAAGLLNPTQPISLAPMNSPLPTFPLAPPPGMKPKPGIEGVVERVLPFGDTGYIKRRRMNVTNVKALRRAGRRVKGFLRVASRLGALPVNRGKGKLFKRKKR